ncbi:MAG TPA: magnesium transporter CorA family protein [Candidatus Saccharimonadales bacterium]
MITYLYKSLRTSELQKPEEYRRGTWINVEDPTEEELRQITDRFKLEPGFLEDALDQDEQPRLEREDDQVYLFVRFAYRKSNGEVDTAPILIIFGGEYVITISREHVQAVDAFLRGRINFATTQRAKLVLQLLVSMSDQYDAFINQTTRQIKGVRSRLRGRGITNTELINFVNIEDELNEFLSSLQPMNAVLRRMLSGRHLPLHEDDQDIVEDLLLSNTQSIEGSKANLRSISNIREAYSAISANNLNRTIELLTVATVALQIPNVVYALFGTNVHIPFEGERAGFLIVLLIGLVPLIVLGYIARKRKIL